MTDWSERDGGFCSANTDAALACLVDRIVSINQKETTIGHPHRVPRWESCVSHRTPTALSGGLDRRDHRTPTVTLWRMVHRTNRSNFDPLTGTDIGPGSDHRDNSFWSGQSR
jgi:hypothetical protein